MHVSPVLIVEYKSAKKNAFLTAAWTFATEFVTITLMDADRKAQFRRSAEKAAS